MLIPQGACIRSLYAISSSSWPSVMLPRAMESDFCEERKVETPDWTTTGSLPQRNLALAGFEELQ